MNMKVLNPSRQKPKAGDIFVLQMPDGLYRYGRVITTDVNIGGFTGCTLVYIYRVTRPTKVPIPELRLDDLLIPPKCTNRLPWARGYFETIEHRPLDPTDVPPVLCFWSPVHDRYMDADGKYLPRRTEPCGLYALGSFRTIDADISRAIGITPAPDTVPNEHRRRKAPK